MVSNYSLEQLKWYHQEASQFFAAELILLKETIPKITDDRLSKASVLLIGCGQTGAAILQLSSQTDIFTREAAMLARAFMETITNFCYIGICDETEYRAFILHPVYRRYHSLTMPRMEDNLDRIHEDYASRIEEQNELRKIPIVQEALTLFSETKNNLSWTKKKLDERIDAIENWGKLLDVFFTISKIKYYSDASEALHGSLYGCTYNLGMFELGFYPLNSEELNKRLYKDNACILLHLGMLIHESLTLISYSEAIEEIWGYSYQNRVRALSLLYHIIEKKITPKDN